MIQEISGICRHCAEEYNVLVHQGEVIGACTKCEEKPVDVEGFDGIVYVLSNPNQHGVKIGMTTKSVEDRARQLSSTGVPGEFEILAIFPSRRARKDEQMVHRKLERYRLAKEHFSLEPLEGVLRTYRALNKKVEPIFYLGSMKEKFERQLEYDQAQMKRRLAGVTGA